MPGSAGVRAGGRPPQKRPSSPGWARRDRCSGSCSSLAGSILLDPLRVRSFESGDARAADAGTAAVMLVIGGDVPDRGVQPDGVVLAADPGELGIEGGRVGDASGQVRPVALQMAEERLDVRLVGRGAGPTVVLGDRSGSQGRLPAPSSHRTVLTLFVYGSSGRRVINPAAGRFTTSIYHHNASCGGTGATMCWCARWCKSTRAMSPRSRKNARLRP